jgi:hypothetical protein
MKRLTILLAILVFGLTSHALAAGKVLSDSAMDQVNAGDWVVLNPGSGNETVADVYYTNNTLDLLNQSQSEINALSNANAIDSAVAVQANVARISSGNSPSENVEVNGSNYADVTNYRAAEAYDNSFVKTSSWTETCATTIAKESVEECSFSLGDSESSESSFSKSSFCEFNLDENADADVDFNESCVVVGKYIDVGTATLDADADYSKVIVKSEGSECSASSEYEKETEIAKTNSEICSFTETKENSVSKEESCEINESARSGKGANNHIALLETSQQNIRALSNLNAVASGAAVQSNVASNVGVSGTITHFNSAIVSSGF